MKLQNLRDIGGNEKFQQQRRRYSYQVLVEILEQMKELISEAQKILQTLENSQEKQRFYSISEFARLTGMNATVIWKLIKKGEIPAIRIGKKYLIPDEVLKLSSFSLKIQKS